MTVVQKPDAYSYASTMKDYLIDSDKSITFAVSYKNKKILEEDYAPDANYQIRIRDLGKVCRQALWGIWPNGDTIQTNVSGEFTFSINGVADSTTTVCYTRLLTMNNAVTGWTDGCFLSNTYQKLTVRGVQEWLTVVVPAGKTVTSNHVNMDGTKGNTKTLLASSTERRVVTIDVSADKLYPKMDIAEYHIMVDVIIYTIIIDRRTNSDINVFRYLNLFDCPETLITRGEITLKGNNESSSGEMYGINRKISVVTKDEYTANSGAIVLQTDYRLWHDFVNAQQVQFLYDGAWYDIVIDKQEFTRSSRKKLELVSFTFSLSNPEATNLILL